MRNDVVIGVSISALVHVAVFFGGVLFPKAPVPKKVVEAKTVIVVQEMPKIEPDEPEKIDVSDEPAKAVEVALPSQVDLPQVVTDTAFVQRIQPPPPDNIKPSPNMVAVPAERGTSGFHAPQVFDPSSLDQQPVARVRPPPQYPFEMLRAEITGEVLVDFIVDSLGNVQNATAIRSSQREFEAAAVQAVTKWKFRPGRRGGRNVNTHMQVPIQFNLNDR